VEPDRAIAGIVTSEYEGLHPVTRLPPMAQFPEFGLADGSIAGPFLVEVGITTTGTSGIGDRRVVTALFADLVDSTSIAETMDPEDWTDLVNRVVCEFASSSAGASKRFEELGMTLEPVST
jgi:hypothetical protein